MAEERRESPDSVALVYGLARTAYRDQFFQRDQQRTRCSALRAFAGILATLSIAAARDAHGSPLIFIGIIALIAAAGLFFAGIVWFSLDTTPRFRELADDYLSSSRRHAELQILGNPVGVLVGHSVALALEALQVGRQIERRPARLGKAHALGWEANMDDAAPLRAQELHRRHIVRVGAYEDGVVV